MSFFNGKDRSVPKTDRELLELIVKKLSSLEDRIDDLEEALGGKELLEEKKELKAEIKDTNHFLRQITLTLIENSKAAAVAAASKPSAVEAYLANKNASAAQSTKELNKTLNNTAAHPKLPG